MDFHNLHEHYQDFFDYNKDKYSHVFYMAIDAEWHNPGSDNKNIVLSYQIATSSRHATSNIIEYMQPGKRLKLGEIIKLGMESVNTNTVSFETLEQNKFLVILTSHNFTAEWSVLADRDEAYITSRLTSVRKSPITDGRPIQISIDMHERTAIVDVLIYDTILLAPASHKSLKSLSVLLGSKEKEKERITQYYIEHMNLYLRDNPDEYKKYALKDSEITLMLFFVLQKALNILVFGGFKKLFRTLASAGVNSFLEKNPWFSDYKMSLRNSKYYKAYDIIKSSYYGGRNESYFVGCTDDYSETKDKIWVDIDFTGCYPTAMALCPKIDTEKEVDYIPLRYEATERADAELLAANISPDILKRVKAALADSVKDFNNELSRLKYHQASKIREKYTVIDNRLVDKWYKSWKQAQQGQDTDIEKFLVPGFARIHFRFPPDTMYPCLPVRHYKYGLLYLLEGETTVTASEIILALEAGAEIKAITSLELPVEQSPSGEPDRFLMHHLSDLIKERNGHKQNKDNPESQVREKLLKEFMNSLYGKFSQAINPRKVFKPATGEMISLGESLITEPCTATLTTALARAALSSVLFSIEHFNRGRTIKNQITVISATTDGLLIGLPAPEGYSVMKDYYEIKEEIPVLRRGTDGKLKEILEQFGCGELLQEMDKYLPIRQMKNSRQEMTGSNEILEIKHMADRVVSVKTRGQIGLLSSGQASIVARFGQKPPLSEVIKDPEEYKRVMDTGGIIKDTIDAQWLLEQIDHKKHNREKIQTYTFITLTAFNKILKSNGKYDLVKLTRPRKFNSDYDWKRKLVYETGNRVDSELRPEKISPFTLPYINVPEMLSYRNQMEFIRRSGYIATCEKVLHRMLVLRRTSRNRGGEPVAVTRMFLRGIIQGKISMLKKLDTYQNLSEKINKVWTDRRLTSAYPKIWSVNDLKNAKRGDWEPGCIIPNISLRELVNELAEITGADPVVADNALFAIEEFETVHLPSVRQVITAVSNAYKAGIEPFYEMWKNGNIPSPEKIITAFRQHMSEDHIRHCMQQAYIPGEAVSSDVKRLKRLFYALGINSALAYSCAKAMIIKPVKASVPRNNPGKTKCADNFVMAVLQSDVSPEILNERTVIKKLAKYGMTSNKYKALRRQRFTPNAISNNPLNRQQILQMSKAFNCDPAYMLGLLLDGK